MPIAGGVTGNMAGGCDAHCWWGNQQCGGRSWLPIASGVTGNMAESFKTLITLGFGHGSHLVNVGC